MVTNFFIGFFGRQMQHFPTEHGCFIKIMLRCRLKTTSDKILELVCEILNVSAKYLKKYDTRSAVLVLWSLSLQIFFTYPVKRTILLYFSILKVSLFSDWTVRDWRLDAIKAKYDNNNSPMWDRRSLLTPRGEGPRKRVLNGILGRVKPPIFLKANPTFH